MADNQWNRKADPVTGAGPQGSGTVRTQSGRLVNINTGMYTPGPSAATQASNTRRISQLQQQHNERVGVGSGAHPTSHPYTGPAFKTPTQSMVGGKNTGKNAFGTPVAMNVRGLQQQLVKLGYKIAVDGQIGPQTLSALRDAFGQPNLSLSTLESRLAQPAALQDLAQHSVGHPEMWDKTHVNVSAPFKPAHINPDGSPKGQMPVTNTGSAPAGNQGSGSTGTVPYSDLLSSLAAASGKALPTSLANFGQMIPTSTAGAIAGAQFDPQIAAAQQQLQLDPGQFAQDLKDISSWYGQVEGAQKQAATNVASMGAAGTGSIGDAANALAQSMGGSANQGAHDIQAAGQNAIGTQAALGQAANTYEQNMGPLLAAEQAEQSVNQQNKNATQLRADQSALAALQSSKGQATQAALAQIIGQNNSLAQARSTDLASILQNNNALGQQSFSNKLALMNAIAAAQSMGIDTQYKQAQINRDAASAQAATQRADLPAFAANHPFKYYQQHDPKFLASVAQEAAGSLVDPTTKQKMNFTPQQAWNIIKGVYQGVGFSPVPGTPSYTAAQSVLNTWMNY